MAWYRCGGGSGKDRPIYKTLKMHSGKINIRDGTIESDDTYYYTDAIPFSSDITFDMGLAQTGLNYDGIALYDSSDVWVDFYAATQRYRNISYSGNATICRLSFRASNLHYIMFHDWINNIMYSTEEVVRITDEEDVPLGTKTITENGTYSAQDDGLLGYSEVTVNVISYKNYIKFNGEGIMLPWSINSDYKIEVTFHETTYYNDSAIIGNSIGPSDMHLTEYNNKYYFLKSRKGETNYGTWSAGEHTFIYNNGAGENTLDGTVISNFTPYNYSGAFYSIGCRGGIKSNVYNGWIKSYKIYSISQDELIHDLRPAIVAGYPCFIDVISNAIYSNGSIQAVDTIT
jgi:hypothetical protein